MISRATGEILFLDDLSFTPQVVLSSDHLRDARSHAPLSVPGWTHFLGAHDSDQGIFEVEAVSDPSCHVQTVFLSHAHPFYMADTPDDAERRVYHEGVIASDLGGQREFSWGQVLCRIDAQENRDWLVVAYTLGPHVPLPRPDILLNLYARQNRPD